MRSAFLTFLPRLVWPAAIAIAIGGCEPSLPACDAAAAREIVYLDAPSDSTDDDGVPMTLGQAIVHTNCSGEGLCHSSKAEGEMRVGVPFGLDFDVAPPCIGSACTDDDETLLAFRAGLRALRAQRRRVYVEAYEGHMPPGHVGATVRGRLGIARRVSPGGTLASGAPIPSLAEDEGRRAFGTWLACGAPVVASVREPDATHARGDSCGSTDDGECVVRLATTVVPPDATWDSIYTRVIGPLCGDSCHGSAAPRAASPSLHGSDAAYDALLHHPSDEGLHYVVPGRPLDSHLLFHIDGDPDHEPMPPALVTHTLPSKVVEAIHGWIENGAARGP